jgi:hypothetical protein
LKTTLNLEGNRVEITAGDETLGSWSLGQVRAERVEGNRFDLILGEDRAVFLADDALAFSYEALPRLAKGPIAEVAQGFRQKLLGSSRRGAKAGALPSSPQLEAEAEPPFATEIDWQEPPGEAPANVKRLRELIEAARANRAEEEEPAASASEEESPEPEVAVLAIDPPMMIVDPEGSEPEPLWAGSEVSRISSRIEDDSERMVPKPRPAPMLIAVENTAAHELLDELEQLMKIVSSGSVGEDQARAAAELIRALRSLLDT